MRRARHLTATAACVLALCSTAHGEDDEESAPPAPRFRFEGETRIGWRLLSGRSDGAFLQDIGLDSGPRVFDLEGLLTFFERDGSAPLIDELEVDAHDLGERSSGGTLRAERFRTDDSSGLRLDAGFRRDVHTFRATADPFSYDTTRDRSHTRIRLRPSRNVTVRFGWDRTDRRGTAFTSADTDLRRIPAPAGVDEDLVSVRRPLSQRFDSFSAAVDASVDGWRLGLSETLRIGRVDDVRAYDVPAARRFGDPVREEFRRKSDSRSATTIGRVGRSLFDGAVDATLIVSHVDHPVDSDLSASAAGFENDFDSGGGAPKGVFRSTSSGETDLERSETLWRFESAWRPHDDWEIEVTTEQDDVIDDSELNLVELRRYERADVGPERIVTHRAGRATLRTDRTTVDVFWDAADDVRLRAGHEWFRQDTEAPLETRRSSLFGSEIRSLTKRWVAGIDAEPAETLDVSLLAHFAEDDAPHVPRSAGDSDEAVVRAKWRPNDAWNASLVGRIRDRHTSERFDHDSESESVTVTARHTTGALHVEASVGGQSIESRTDTSFFVLDGAFRQVNERISLRRHDRTATLHAIYDLNATTRVSAGGSRVRSRGDLDLRTHQLFATLEHDLEENVTAGFAVRSWKYDERHFDRDDYDAEALEVFFVLRFP